METILTRLQQSFAARQSSSSKKRYSNASLGEQAAKCLEHYTHKEVSKAIGMSINTLRLWQKSLCCDKETIDSPSGFVAISLDQVQDTNETSRLSLPLQISLPSGIVNQIYIANVV